MHYLYLNPMIKVLKYSLRLSCQTSIWKSEFLLYHFTQSVFRIYLIKLTEYLMKYKSLENSAFLGNPSSLKMNLTSLLVSPLILIYPLKINTSGDTANTQNCI